MFWGRVFLSFWLLELYGFRILGLRFRVFGLARSLKVSGSGFGALVSEFGLVVSACFLSFSEELLMAMLACVSAFNLLLVVSVVLRGERMKCCFCELMGYDYGESRLLHSRITRAFCIMLRAIACGSNLKL